MTDDQTKKVRAAYAEAELQEARVVRLKDLIAEANAQGEDDTELRAFAETLVKRATDLRRAADMLANGAKH